MMLMVTDDGGYNGDERRRTIIDSSFTGGVPIRAFNVS
jgi:hypothetical protein